MSTIRIFDSTLELSKTAAEEFIQAAREAVEERGKFTVALTGGSSPLHLYQLLAQSPYRERVPWSQTYVFWGDERWVPLTDEKSNAKMAFENLLDLVPIPKDQIFPMWGEQEPEEFALYYESLLHQHLDEAGGSFDLILLGMGDDGHTASLFPGTAVLEEKSRWVQAYYLAPQEMYRVTLTAPCINRASKIVFLTFGEKKADALYEVLQGEHNPRQYPSQLINPKNGEVLWLVGKAAAQKLE
ncbi:6-phosphogluconolactonase [Cesiribacter sp. SM1]|uniref:6-phosphogluconolactonase n=1 Tax=Cesiribacter sp. SM1 TaxID=2861196 RepID=UPI001CD4C8C3|nr:6-phosphogluconolactonase [Cesiribacter sp. SM1]